MAMCKSVELIFSCILYNCRKWSYTNHRFDSL